MEIIYRANDRTEFDDQFECEKYEEECKVQDFLSRVIFQQNENADSIDTLKDCTSFKIDMEDYDFFLEILTNFDDDDFDFKQIDNLECDTINVFFDSYDKEWKIIELEIYKHNQASKELEKRL